jgi:hypothetical protein
MKPNKRAQHSAIHERSDYPKTKGFTEKLKKLNEFMKEKNALLRFLRAKREKVNRNENPEEFSNFIKLSEEIHKIMDAEQQKFMAINGEEFREWEEWLKANPK